jgi:hypothetical protein
VAEQLSIFEGSQLGGTARARGRPGASYGENTTGTSRVAFSKGVSLPDVRERDHDAFADGFGVVEEGFHGWVGELFSSYAG